MENKENVNSTTRGENELGRCVYVPYLARKLLRMNYKIIDIKPNRANPARSVFVFGYTDKIDSDLEELIAKREDNSHKETVHNGNELGRCVYVPCLARKLLHLGYEIIDIKPNRVSPERTVFVFRYTDKIDNDLKDLIEEVKEQRENTSSKTAVNEMVRDTFLDNKEWF